MNKIYILLFFSLFMAYTYASDNGFDPCLKFKSGRELAVYLLDENDQIVSGQADFGAIYDDGRLESKVINSKYKLLVGKKIKPIGTACSMDGCLFLSAKKGLCVNAKVYSVGVNHVFRPSSGAKSSVTQIGSFMEIGTIDDETGDEIPLDYKFSKKFKLTISSKK
ncbi:hypothetical protein R6242_21795 [Iodobacter sp. CM08]|uniref:hypothetical protein n=1 Tax=Iodobacter sp. CM08 TaxID=3085902 RepID=UPI0029828B56|nr:hypothetical protein [Iodobacter sp. CM08]MDW5419211.1 hypothetical protein [Iodobacter sp. CM08]